MLSTLKTTDFYVPEEECLVVKKVTLNSIIEFFIGDGFVVEKALCTQESLNEFRHPEKVSVYIENKHIHALLNITRYNAEIQFLPL